MRAGAKHTLSPAIFAPFVRTSCKPNPAFFTYACTSSIPTHDHTYLRPYSYQDRSMHSGIHYFFSSPRASLSSSSQINWLQSFPNTQDNDQLLILRTIIANLLVWILIHMVISASAHDLKSRTRRTRTHCLYMRTLILACMHLQTVFTRRRHICLTRASRFPVFLRGHSISTYTKKRYRHLQTAVFCS